MFPAQESTQTPDLSADERDDDTTEAKEDE